VDAFTTGPTVIHCRGIQTPWSSMSSLDPECGSIVRFGTVVVFTMGTLDATQDEAAWKQLERIVASSAFSGTPGLSSLLRYIVSKTLAGRGGQLKEYRVAVAALAGGVSFDPRIDSIVRVEASKLRSQLETYYKEAGANDPVLIELPRGGYVK
jgi:hypothetical protein